MEVDAAAQRISRLMGVRASGVSCQMLASSMSFSLETSVRVEVRSNYIGVECWGDGHLIEAVKQGRKGRNDPRRGSDLP